MSMQQPSWLPPVPSDIAAQETLLDVAITAATTSACFADNKPAAVILAASLAVRVIQRLIRFLRAPR
jgi:hypothetical protein